MVIQERIIPERAMEPVRSPVENGNVSSVINSLADLHGVCYSPEDTNANPYNRSGMHYVMDQVSRAKQDLVINTETVIASRRFLNQHNNHEPEKGSEKWEYRKAQSILRATPELTKNQRITILDGGDIYIKYNG